MNNESRCCRTSAEEQRWIQAAVAQPEAATENRQAWRRKPHEEAAT